MLDGLFPPWAPWSSSRTWISSRVSAGARAGQDWAHGGEIKRPNPNFASAEAVLQQPRVPAPPDLTKVNNPLPQKAIVPWMMIPHWPQSGSDFKLLNSTEVSQWRTSISSVHIHCAKSNINPFCPGNSTVCTKREFSISLRTYSFFLQLLLTAFS